MPPQPPSAASSSASSVSPLASPGPGAPASAFPALGPADLPAVLADPNALILDIRPHNAHLAGRLHGALSLSVPTTLLKRPTYTLARLAPMLPSPSARARFAAWRDSSRIVVHDADAGGLPERPALLGLLRKFRAEGFDERRQVAWIRGGINAVGRERPDLLDHSPLPDEGEEEEDDVAELAPPSSSSAPATSAPFPAQNIKALRTKALPMSAFTSASTIGAPPSFRAPPATVSTEGTIVPPTSATGASILGSIATRGEAVPPTTVPSLLAARATKLHNPMNTQAAPSSAFNLRLPAFASAPGMTLPPQTAAATQSSHAFPPVAGTSSMPTLSGSPEAFSASVAGMRPHRHSVPHGRTVAFNPFFDAIRQNLELAHRTEPSGEGGRGSGIALRLPRRVRRRVGDLPFEWLREIARRSGRTKESGSESESDADEEPQKVSVKITVPPLEDGGVDSADDSADATSASSQSSPSAEELTRALELQFYRIELGEQRRLMGVMEHHSMESQAGAVSVSAAGVVPVGAAAAVASRAKGGEKMKLGEEDFPFSITAGLEKGNKNRYRNIWPFEHARVRLRKARPDDDDYMNASYVQPLGTTKRYIATQGPLAATYADFWTLCWEQNVHVIVMLTREVEGNTVKCGKYWAEGEYGPLRLKLIATDDTPERERQKHGSDSDGERDIVHRVFKLTHTGYPQAKPRVVTQLQYLDWPDFNVPEDPRGLLGLVREVEEADVPMDDNYVDPTTGVARHAIGNPPVLLHCSAGVGRTGGYIAVDSVLDGIRREMRKRREDVQPRRLHTDMSPPLLSTYDEPIRRVIEDMREQRMSLCQSLRQYVFVYRAVIEGTLMIVDEERKAEELSPEGTRTAKGALLPDRQDIFMDGPMHSLETVSSVSSGASLRERGVSRKRSISDYMREDAAIDGHLSMSPGGTKRGASPTELPKEGVQGEAMLTKRPSIKRTSRMDTV
ncbi:protein-tyrosine phosphatase-like protein [Fomitopsis serialis]|uniref:protein-tyrosine phosphatase-like protein n=1 Tax=Fomitopsis serialis TaxID=139415 RepID=UPI0020079CAB|nr:protein-tyrosine phosphatase-like protein [Neoantrodia serialis]KAH9931213.1 protein-tyrosine phosphatase-like protein [Neoantrodia serialis]